MSYYLLPSKHNSYIQFDIKTIDKLSPTAIKPFISQTLITYISTCFDMIHKTIQRNFQAFTKDNNSYLINDEKELIHVMVQKLTSVVNHYDYIYINVPGSKYSVSKLKTDSNIFYNIMKYSNYTS